MLETPILLITYNRLEPVKQVFEQIKKVQPARLYIASDGAKEKNPSDVDKVNKVREWLDCAVDWSCEVKKRYSNKNQGCQMGVSSAISWAFEQEEGLIILEDDIVADISFFYFCQEMLLRYKDDSRIMTISGYKKVWDFPIEGDYFFSYFSPIWGWATWKRAWEYFDVKMKKWPYYKQKKMLSEIFEGGATIGLSEEFERTYMGQLSSWAYPWLFTRLSNSGLGIVPKVNLIRNIGYDKEEATHTRGKAPAFQVDSIQLPTKTEENVIRNWEYDRAYEHLYFKINHIKRIIRRFVPKMILNCWYKLRGVI